MMFPDNDLPSSTGGGDGVALLRARGVFDDGRGATVAGLLAAGRGDAPDGLGPVVWVADIGSTNSALAAVAASGAAAGIVLTADHQSAGRGRRDRRWVTEPGDALLVSVLFRVPASPEALGAVSTAVAVAACTALRRTGFDGVAIKWPNDLVVDLDGTRHKIAGVLAQSAMSAPAAGAAQAEADVVVGMGLNVEGRRLGQLVPERPVAALGDLVARRGSGRTPERPGLLAAILTELEAWSDGGPVRDATSLWEAYRGCSATLGHRVVVTTDDEVIEGIAVDMSPTGALVVDTGEVVREIVVGDVVTARA